MSEFSCSICQYTSSKKENIAKHFTKKKSCGIGNKEIIEIPIEIKCEFCNKNFSTKTYLKDHVKNVCKYKIDLLSKQLEEAKNKIKELENRPTTTITNNIILINNYENTNLDILTDKTYNKLIRDANEIYQIIPNLIKHIHFNSQNPENHNIYLSNRNKNNKYLQIFKNNQWEAVNKSSEIDNIISEKETNISDWVSEKSQKYPEAAEKYNEYLEQKYDSDVAKLIKEEVELVLYNGRHLIKTQ